MPASQRVVGSTPGIYGGSGQATICDARQLVTFLSQHPDRARAWAAVEGISPSQIQAYVQSLTAVILRGDTAITNHGFVAGHATGFQAILEAGTAVLVDQFGVPRVKCSCGNPLTGAPALPSPGDYIGARWAGFDPARVVIVERSSVAIRVFTLIDITTGRRSTKPAGNSVQSPPASPSSGGPATTGGRARIGQTLTVGGFDYHVNSGTWKVTLLKFVDPQPSSSPAAPHRYVGAFVRVENVGAKVSPNGFPVTAVNTDAVQLVTNRGVVAVPAVSAGTGECTDSTPVYQNKPLAPGASIAGCYSFYLLGAGEQPQTLKVGDGTWSLK